MNNQVEAAQRLYAVLAPNYDNETRYITGIRKQAIDALNLQPGETVLDAGCGTGWCLPILADESGRAAKSLASSHRPTCWPWPNHG